MPPPGPDSEEWRPVVGRPRYQVSSHGRIFGPSGRVLKPYLAGKYLAFRPGLGATNVYVHRAVAMAFHGAPLDGQEVGHGDGNRFNNRADNLSWVTRGENAADRMRHGTTHKGKRFISVEREARVLHLLAHRDQFGLSVNSIARLAGVSTWVVDKVVDLGARQPVA